eukprot:822368_1
MSTSGNFVCNLSHIKQWVKFKKKQANANEDSDESRVTIYEEPDESTTTSEDSDEAMTTIEDSDESTTTIEDSDESKTTSEDSDENDILDRIHACDTSDAWLTLGERIAELKENNPNLKNDKTFKSYDRLCDPQLKQMHSARSHKPWKNAMHEILFLLMSSPNNARSWSRSCMNDVLCLLHTLINMIFDPSRYGIDIPSNATRIEQKALWHKEIPRSRTTLEKYKEAIPCLPIHYYPWHIQIPKKSNRMNKKKPKRMNTREQQELAKNQRSKSTYTRYDLSEFYGKNTCKHIAKKREKAEKKRQYIHEDISYDLSLYYDHYTGKHEILYLSVIDFIAWFSLLKPFYNQMDFNFNQRDNINNNTKIHHFNQTKYVSQHNIYEYGDFTGHLDNGHVIMKHDLITIPNSPNILYWIHSIYHNWCSCGTVRRGNIAR